MKASLHPMRWQSTEGPFLTGLAPCKGVDVLVVNGEALVVRAMDELGQGRPHGLALQAEFATS
jgi:hypothetical protein